MTLEQAVGQAKAHVQAGQWTQADTLLRQILAAQPEYTDALHLLGYVVSTQGRPGEAMPLLTRAAGLDPNNPAITLTLGQAQYALGQLDDAAHSFQNALARHPNYAAAHYNLGMVHKDRNETDTAIASLERALALEPNLAEGHSHLGALLFQQGETNRAITHYQRALTLKPDFADAAFNLGLALASLSQLAPAIACYRRALALKPDFLQALQNLAVVLYCDGRYEEAILCSRQVLAQRPDTPEAYHNIGNVWKDTGHLPAALDAYRTAEALQPDNPRRLSPWLFALHFDPAQDAASLLAAHREWHTRHEVPRQAFQHPHANSADPEKRLRIGYLSPDMTDHSVARFLLPLLQAHNHSQFEICCYADVPNPTHYTDRLRAHADQWRFTHRDDEAALDATIRADGIDILVDMALHTPRNSLAVFARKPAPVQVSYLAYCSTSGLDAIDYRLTDPHIDPPGMGDDYYSEQSVRLPDTYWAYPPPSDAPEVALPPPALRGKGVTFACLNAFCKVNPETLRVWARILQAVPHSRLLLHTEEGSHRKETRDALRAYGVHPKRVNFVGKAAFREFCAYYHAVDIALDPFPFGGGTTTCDALWMGVPVVSLAGRTAVGRGGVSILSNISLPELIACTEDEYVHLAATLAHDLPRLAHLRETLREKMTASPLMDTARFARAMEAAYRQMWHSWCLAQSPRS